MSRNIPGQALIYERANGVVYARYRDPPYDQLPRWVIGGSPEALRYGNLISYSDWKDLIAKAEDNPVLKKQLDNLVQTYLLLKDKK